ncbi:hypothetical protein C1646_776803 [Rhizophagus diaphanus]|nr:hypothetical protein C1646_776803 [Rhizophagus diaphanus] [Rhizophagus sp. MUCL 43196]
MNKLWKLKREMKLNDQDLKKNKLWKPGHEVKLNDQNLKKRTNYERTTTTLADCFIILVQLAVKINKIPHELIGYIQIIKSQIAKYASSLLYNSGYKSKNATSKLIANMAEFKYKYGIYSLEYDEFRSPQICASCEPEVLKESNLFNEEELEDNDNYNNLESEIVEANQISQHNIYVLIMANDIDLSEPVFDNESNKIDGTRANKELITNSNENENEFNINKTIVNISFKF